MLEDIVKEASSSPKCKLLYKTDQLDRDENRPPLTRTDDALDVLVGITRLKIDCDQVHPEEKEKTPFTVKPL